MRRPNRSPEAVPAEAAVRSERAARRREALWAFVSAPVAPSVEAYLRERAADDGDERGHALAPMIA